MVEPSEKNENKTEIQRKKLIILKIESIVIADKRKQKWIQWHWNDMHRGSNKHQKLLQSQSQKSSWSRNCECFWM